MAFLRVVRFTDVDPQRMREMRARIEAEGGPPEGVTIEALKVVMDESQRTAVVIQEFATAEDMEASAAVFAAMDPEDTPGTRASVDSGEAVTAL